MNDLGFLITNFVVSMQEVPSLEIPLHTLIELTPKADGTMAETRFHVDVDRALKEIDGSDLDEALEAAVAAASRSSMDTKSDDLNYHQHHYDMHSFSAPEPGHAIPSPGSSPSKSSREGTSFVRRSISMAELAKAEVVTVASVAHEYKEGMEH